MTDIIDRAQRQHDYWLADALLRHAERSRATRARPALHNCQDCAEPIAPERRRAVPGVRRCLACQQRLEAGPK